jgi:hypothetical protein
MTKSKNRKFRRGNIVCAGTTTILVTGPGSCKYPSFAGVVIKEEALQSSWKIGYYSKTWTESAFEKVNQKIILQ